MFGSRTDYDIQYDSFAWNIVTYWVEEAMSKGNKDTKKQTTKTEMGGRCFTQKFPSPRWGREYNILVLVFFLVYENFKKINKQTKRLKVHTSGIEWGFTFRYGVRIIAPFHSQIRYINATIWMRSNCKGTVTQIARYMGPTWGPPGADRTQVGRM